MEASFGFSIFNVLILKAMPQSPEISLCSVSLFIHDDASLIRKPH